MTGLAAERCQACHGRVSPLTSDEALELLAELSEGWTIRDQVLRHRFTTPDFLSAFVLTTSVALLAEREGHHPDLLVGWGYLEIKLTTHAAAGLTRNDFIIAAKVDKAVAAKPGHPAP